MKKNQYQLLGRMWRDWNAHTLLLRVQLVQPVWKNSLAVSVKAQPHTYSPFQQFHSSDYPQHQCSPMCSKRYVQEFIAAPYAIAKN